MFIKSDSLSIAIVREADLFRFIDSFFFHVLHFKPDFKDVLYYYMNLSKYVFSSYASCS